MKEIKEIVDGVAHSLNMTVDNVVKIYPQLRTEYSWFYTCDTLQNIFSVTLIVILVVGGFSSIGPLIDDFADEEDIKRAFKILKWVLMFSAVFAILLLVTTVLKAFMCPDIMIIKDFIK